MKNKKNLFLILLMIISVTSIFVNVKAESYTKQDFTISNETKELLDLESNYFYYGNLTITVISGDNVTATFNGQVKEVAVGQFYTFVFNNVTSLYFSLSVTGSAQGYFELRFTTEYDFRGNRSFYITIAVLGGLFFLGAVISIYMKTKKVETKPEEESEDLTDPEVVRRRKEAAGAEKRFWGLEKKD